MNKIANRLITILQENKVNYEINPKDNSDCTIVILSEKAGRKINIELYDGGYNFHFSIDGSFCVCYHDMWEFNENSSYEGESLINLISEMINEKLVGIILERGDYSRSHIVEFPKVDKFLKKEMLSLEYSHEKGFLKNKQYRFLIRSFKGTEDKDLQGTMGDN